MNTSTDDLVQALILKAKRTQRCEDVLLLDRSAKNAAAVKKAQREERAALTALNRHFKECIKVVRRKK